MYIPTLTELLRFVKRVALGKERVAAPVITTAGLLETAVEGIYPTLQWLGRPEIRWVRVESESDCC